MSKSADEKYEKMTTGPVSRLILSLAAPTIISMLVTALYNLADTFFVRLLEVDSMVAAVGIVMPLMNIIQAVGFFFGHGSGNYISRALGRQDREDAQVMAATGFFYSISFGIVFCILGMLFNDQLAVLLGAKTEASVRYSVEYMRYILLAMPFMCGSFVINNQLRMQGNAFFAMIGITTGAVLNVLLDPIFIFTLGMGVAGASFATAISQVISFFILLTGMYRSDNIKISIKNISKKISYISNIAKGGLPSLARQGLASVAVISLNHAIGIYIADGAVIDAVQAAMTGTTKIMMFFMSIMIGFGQGFQPVCGFNYGAGKYDRVREAFFFALKVSSVALVIISGIGFVFSDQLTNTIVGTSPTAAKIAAETFRIQIVVFPLFAYTNLCNMMLQNIGKTLEATILAMTRQGIAFIPLIFILPYILNPLTGIEITQAISDVFAFVIALPFGIRTLRQLKDGSIEKIK